ncbi:uncharacterized protein B0H18DRAFT_311074 [Fomitopsis serialis]|uniref:uncharacterized protein n=1 Tax=Fomitopsis serialis TaxID=139415 RepID=UPI0020078AA7|nr:uncharacterized protein B0H18DRAFT_311074 [Neoantrodia serialis]KAH9911716.1 hypothetical protein B0H18DRAFT_311074 [Neoantrodia serialis]
MSPSPSRLHTTCCLARMPLHLPAVSSAHYLAPTVIVDCLHFSPRRLSRALVLSCTVPLAHVFSHLRPCSPAVSLSSCHPIPIARPCRLAGPPSHRPIISQSCHLAGPPSRSPARSPSRPPSRSLLISSYSYSLPAVSLARVSLTCHLACAQSHLLSRLHDLACVLLPTPSRLHPHITAIAHSRCRSTRNACSLSGTRRTVPHRRKRR